MKIFFMNQYDEEFSVVLPKDTIFPKTIMITNLKYKITLEIHKQNIQ
jgi:hypothetical protein